LLRDWNETRNLPKQGPISRRLWCSQIWLTSKRQTYLTVYIIKKFIFNSPVPINYMYIDETYANGDGTDSWCSNHVQLPSDLYFNDTYKHPENGIWSCCKAVMNTLIPLQIEIYNDSSLISPCSDRNRPFAWTVFFLCMSWLIIIEFMVMALSFYFGFANFGGITA
jgi:hypothetical protein